MGDWWPVVFGFVVGCTAPWHWLSFPRAEERRAIVAAIEAWRDDLREPLPGPAPTAIEVLDEIVLRIERGDHERYAQEDDRVMRKKE